MANSRGVGADDLLGKRLQDDTNVTTRHDKISVSCFTLYRFSRTCSPVGVARCHINSQSSRRGALRHSNAPSIHVAQSLRGQHGPPLTG